VLTAVLVISLHKKTTGLISIFSRWQIYSDSYIYGHCRLIQTKRRQYVLCCAVLCCAVLCNYTTFEHICQPLFVILLPRQLPDRSYPAQACKTNRKPAQRNQCKKDFTILRIRCQLFLPAFVYTVQRRVFVLIYILKF